MKWKRFEGKNEVSEFVEYEKGRELLVLQRGNDGWWYIFYLQRKSPRSKKVERIVTVEAFKTKKEGEAFLEKLVSDESLLRKYIS